MKELYDELRDLMPQERGSKASKWEILSKGKSCLGLFFIYYAHTNYFKLLPNTGDRRKLSEDFKTISIGLNKSCKPAAMRPPN